MVVSILILYDSFDWRLGMGAWMEKLKNFIATIYFFPRSCQIPIGTKLGYILIEYYRYLKIINIGSKTECWMNPLYYTIPYHAT